MPASSTPTGEQGQHPDPKQRDNAEAKMHAAPLKNFEDLPADHPMARRAAMMAEIEAANELVDASKETIDDATTAAVAKAADGEATTTVPISAFTDPVLRDDKGQFAAKPKTDAADAAAQVAEQTGAPIVLDAADLSKYQVRTKIDGVEELVPAAKALGQYQKGAAADVRLAHATKLQREAEAALAAVAKPTVAAPTESSTAPARSATAVAKFKEASEALYSGRVDEASQLFEEAVALGSSDGSAQRTGGAIADADIARVTSNVVQQLSKQGALKQLFTDYPEIQQKRAFGLIADEYAAAFMANGDDVATAIIKAGDAIGEEYGLGKWSKTHEAPKDNGRPLKTSGPTTRAEKLTAKAELDVIASGGARSTTTEPRELSVAEQLEEMRKARPGQALG